MASAARGAEEEVFETPDIAEDDRDQQEVAARSDSALSKTAHKVQDAEVVAAFVPPQAAFEVFMGRTYAGAREDMSDVVGTAASSSLFEGDRGGGAVYEGNGYHRPRPALTAPGEGGGDGSVAEGVGGEGAAGPGAGAGARRRTEESPMQRLVRLREETAMLAEDLEEMSKARSKDRAEGQEEGQEGDGGGGDGAGYALWSAMAKETECLQRQLAALSGDPRYKHIVSSSPPPAGQAQEALQQRLSDGVVKALEGLRESAAEAEATKSAAAAGGEGGTDPGSSVTFELFLSKAAEARRRLGPVGAQEAGVASSGIGGISGAEARIAALEKALGGVGGEAGGGGAGLVGKGGEATSLCSMVESLENRVAILEPGRLDALRQKAQLAKAELDGLAKSGSSSSSSSSSSASRNKKLEEAFATLEAWQGIAAGLPALVDRLQALETLHLASASFAQRLEQVETGQTELEVVLQSTNEGLVATRESSVENLTIVKDNVEALDRRLAGVGLPA